MLVMDKSSLSELFLPPRPLYLGDFSPAHSGGGQSFDHAAASLHPAALLHWAKIWAEHQQQHNIFSKLSPGGHLSAPVSPLGVNLSLLSPPRKQIKLSAFSPVAASSTSTILSPNRGKLHQHHQHSPTRPILIPSSHANPHSHLSPRSYQKPHHHHQLSPNHDIENDTQGLDLSVNKTTTAPISPQPLSSSPSSLLLMRKKVPPQLNTPDSVKKTVASLTSSISLKASKSTTSSRVVVVDESTPCTPTSSSQQQSSSKRGKQPNSPSKKTKAVRRLQFDEDKSSPVSGTIIRDIGSVRDERNQQLLLLKEDEKYEETTPLGIQVTRRGDIDPAFNTVEVTEEAREELSKIENKIGAYVCRLCQEKWDDAFELARHRCACIIHVEYRCPECEKVFSCPANLASHRRWHRPRNGGNNPISKNSKSSKSSSKWTKNKSSASSSSVHLDLVVDDDDENDEMSSDFHPSSFHQDQNHPMDIINKVDESNLQDQHHQNAKSRQLLEFDYNCVICRKTFRDYKDFQVHLASHLIPEKHSLPFAAHPSIHSPNTSTPLMSPLSSTSTASPSSRGSSQGSI